ncbi:hypothetical protein [Chryseobacterium jejuense]|uniref:Uncharacterized protein n=1 Tax=Chryseobacterium jejuense TaxID=445960 RepID=A0A2X2X1V1_CHRJE|nr:hypothetical protein [Chryseobacterium jejuense]SDI19523.1 hypothetical protein SAMN05421542_0386 [Chryseobacterium jejuense]SQB46654.1 Uncharacterised protein [Chryseobacterium jejuense]
MRKKLLIYSFLLFTIISCQSQEYGKDIFDLEKLSLTMNVEKFYKKSMAGSIRDLNYVEKKTVNEYDVSLYGDRNTIVGIEYDVKSYSPEDTVAKFKELTFSQLETFTTEKGDLMLMSATGKIPYDKVQNTIVQLTKAYKEPTVEKKEFSLFTSYHYTWVLDDRLIQIVSGKKLDFDQPHIILSEKEKNEIQEIESDNLEETHLYICSKAHVDQLKGKLNSGDWSDFK